MSTGKYAGSKGLEAWAVAEVAAGQDMARSTGSSTTQHMLPMHSVLVLLPIVWLVRIQYIP